MKGLIVDVMGDDCTNHGVTSGKDRALLVGEGIPEIFEADDMPILKIVPGYGSREYMAIPYDCDISKTYAMFGGHFIYSCDGRFPYDHPIHVHDRFETQEEYNEYSK